MIKINKQVSYTLKCCHCENTMTVTDFNKVDGWKIISDTYPIKEDYIKDIKCPDCVRKEYDELYNSESIHDRVKTRYYYEEGHNFYTDLVKYLDIDNHPKRSVFINLVSDHGDDYLCNKLYFAEELAQLLK